MSPTHTASMGHQSRLALKKESTYGTFVVPDTRLVFVSENIRKAATIVERQGIRGTRSHNADDTRLGTYSVGGQIVLEPTPQDLAVLFPLILGADASGTTFALAETIPSFSLVIDRVAKIFTYVGCKVSRATFSGSSGALLRLTLDIIGQKEGGYATTTFTEGVEGSGFTGATFPSLTASVTQPFIFHDILLSLISVSRDVSSFELVIDNALITDRFMNSRTIVNAPESDRVVTLTTTHPYNADNLDLYNQALAGSAATLTWHNPAAWASAGDAGYGTIWTFATLQVPDNAPTVANREAEIPLSLTMAARVTGSTAEVSVSHDSTA